MANIHPKLRKADRRPELEYLMLNEERLEKYALWWKNSNRLIIDGTKIPMGARKTKKKQQVSEEERLKSEAAMKPKIRRRLSLASSVGETLGNVVAVKRLRRGSLTSQARAFS